MERGQEDSKLSWRRSKRRRRVAVAARTRFFHPLLGLQLSSLYFSLLPLPFLYRIKSFSFFLRLLKIIFTISLKVLHSWKIFPLTKQDKTFSPHSHHSTSLSCRSGGRKFFGFSLSLAPSSSWQITTTWTWQQKNSFFLRNVVWGVEWDGKFCMLYFPFTVKTVSENEREKLKSFSICYLICFIEFSLLEVFPLSHSRNGRKTQNIFNHHISPIYN